ncbi:hypothetical protein MPDQ_005448 [Monascus purpureus]|uniref:Uncharacterized protein n=1 Tax=Monascus purpureus TaxID=5098 RepID=A0A507R0E1_MONPU|nr:hypothetical protein MPDQ_005448 [Monascus purpureus]BDD57807.1 hypothetical protein MAP00_003141 [Monascus purpureus]
MTHLRHKASILGFAFTYLFLYLIFRLSSQWHDSATIVRMGDSIVAPSPMPSRAVWNISNVGMRPRPHSPRPQYAPGLPKLPGSAYSKIIVVARTREEDTSWMARELPDWQTAIYVADDPTAPLHPPKNKGHEVMVYLTYIIDHYDNLPDIIAFIHSHQFAWHIDELFGGDAVVMLQRLNPARVIREGYTNLRCIWNPGCPDWMHPGAREEDESKQEETIFAHTWGELFPNEPVPDVLAQPCCAQFAVSRERILAIPKSRFIFYRDWVLKTDLSDYISGRIWEYLWHVVFSGQYTVCPKEHVCYCDGYGACFGGEKEYDAFRGLGFQKQDLERELQEWQAQTQSIELARMDESIDVSELYDVPAPGRDVEIAHEIAEKEKAMQKMIDEAVARGNDPRLRALEVGREWKEGDGF